MWVICQGRGRQRTKALYLFVKSLMSVKVAVDNLMSLDVRLSPCGLVISCSICRPGSLRQIAGSGGDPAGREAQFVHWPGEEGIGINYL
jgi:hypothetical protein